MNLIEAHKSGRRWRRAGRSIWLKWNGGVVRGSDDLRYTIPFEDSIADDYELEPEAKLLTEGDVMYAVELAQGQMISFYYAKDLAKDLAKEVVKILFKGEGK